MKKQFLLAIFVTIFTAILFIGNCSDPLESLGPETDIDTVFSMDTVKIIDTLNYSDTLFVVDTILIIDTLDYSDTLFVIDTFIVIDTIDNWDTLYVVDTVESIDTVVIVVTDSTQYQTICAQINSNQKEIVWMFRNEDGDYRLEFMASQDGKKPEQILRMDIDGHEYLWKPAKNPELIKELYLGQNSIISIITSKPPALGHPIHICLTISKL